MATEEQTTHGRDGGAVSDALALFASRLSYCRFGNEELRVLEAALSAGGDVAAMIETRSAARRVLRERVAEAFAAAAVQEEGARLSIADFFARAFALVGDVESCLAMRYEALVLREVKCSDDLHLHVSREEWLTFAKDSLDNGFYSIASKAYTNALLDNNTARLGYLESSYLILKKDKIDGIRGLQNLAKSLSAPRSVQAQSADYMKRKALGVNEECTLHPGKPKLPGSSMFRRGIKTRNVRKLLHSQGRSLEEL